MELVFFGHDYRYAAEQMLLTLFPSERPVYPQSPGEGDRAEISLADGRAACTLYRAGKCYTGQAEVGGFSNLVESDRARQRAVKLAFYRAALSSGVSKPAWGALTGVKPGKLLLRTLAEGKTAEDFARDFDVSPARAALCRETTQHTLLAKASLAAGDLCLYVGIPFCPTRCAYCSFVSNSVEKSGTLLEPYLMALSREIERVSQEVEAAGQRIVSLYMGGGTPTTLTAEQLNALCRKLSESFSLPPCGNIPSRPGGRTPSRRKSLRF